MHDLFDELAERAFPRREFTLIDANFEYTVFSGVVTSLVCETHDAAARATVGDVELVETGNKLARHGADELPQISL